MTVREKAELIVKDIKKEQGTNPVVIFKQIAEKEMCIRDRSYVVLSQEEVEALRKAVNFGLGEIEKE